MREFQIGDRVSYGRCGMRGIGIIAAISNDYDAPYWIEIEDGEGHDYSDIKEIAEEDDISLLPDKRYYWAREENMVLISPGVNYKLIKTEFLQGVEL